MGVGEEPGEGFPEPEEDYEELPPREVDRSRRKLVPIRGARLAKLVISEPQSFDEVQMLADHIKNRRPVIVNVQKLDREVAKRILDFAGGVIYALDGGMQKIGEGIFLLTPSNFEVAGDISPEEQKVPFF